MKNLFSTLFIFSFLIKGLTAQELIQKVYGELGSNEDRGECIIATADGGSLVAGKAINPTTQFFDAFLLKLDANGEKMWYKTFESAKNSVANEVVQSPDGGFIFCGTFENDDNYGTAAAIKKVNADGNLVWEKNKDGLPNEGFTCIIRLLNGNYLASGFQDKYSSETINSPSKFTWVEISENGEIIKANDFEISSNCKPIKILESDNQIFRFLVKNQNYTVLYFLENNLVVDRTGVQYYNVSEKSKNFQMYAHKSGTTFIAFLCKNNDFISHVYLYTGNGYSLISNTGNQGVMLTDMLNDSLLQLKIFAHSNEYGTVISTYIYNLMSPNIYDTGTTEYNTFNSSDVNMMVQQGNHLLMLANDTLTENGEMDFRVIKMLDSSQNREVLWEESFGSKSKNNFETLLASCITKLEDNIVIYSQYNPDYQHFILQTDNVGNLKNDKVLTPELPDKDYTLIDMKPTPDGGAAVLVRTIDNLRLWKISKNGSLEYDKKLNVSGYLNEYKVLIVREKGFALFNNVSELGGETFLYIFDENLQIIGYRKIKVNAGNFISNGICLPNNEIMLIENILNFDLNQSPTIKTTLTDKDGFFIKENILKFDEIRNNEPIQLKLIENSVLIYLKKGDQYTQTILKVNKLGQEIDRFYLHEDTRNGMRILDIRESTCNGLVVIHSQESLLNSNILQLKFQHITKDGIQGVFSTINNFPDFSIATTDDFLQGFNFSYWTNGAIVDNTLDLVFRKISFPRKNLDVTSKKINILHNPSSNSHLCLNLTNDYNGDFELEIYDTNGRLIKTYSEFKPSGAWENSYFVPGLNIGTYFIRAKIGADNYQAKWINISK
jgi:hypothetical protein